tara:strand:- start:25600 stop:26142 length:543 start_codon:yes stop_codon:yes gene_type:complete
MGLKIVKRSSKAQIGMIEMIMVLLVVFIIIGLVMIIYYNFFRQNIEDTKQELSLQEANILLASITSRPEFQCSFRGNTRECIDMSKVTSLSISINKNIKYYADIFKSKTIKIELLYPKDENGLCDQSKYNKKEYPDNCNLWTIYDNVKGENKAITSTPISLYFPSSKEFRVGKLIVEVES